MTRHAAQPTTPPAKDAIITTTRRRFARRNADHYRRYSHFHYVIDFIIIFLHGASE